MCGRKRPPQFGVAAIFTPPMTSDVSAKARPRFDEFLFSHVTLIEGHVNKLQEVVERSLQTRQLNKIADVRFFQFTSDCFSIFIACFDIIVHSVLVGVYHLSSRHLGSVFSEAY